MTSRSMASSDAADFAVAHVGRSCHLVALQCGRLPPGAENV
jgi:hypothetical protein